MRAELEVQNSEGAGTGGSTPVRSSVSRGACWRRGHKVLVVMLLWMVVPIEAATGGATILVGTAVAAAAAGVGAAVNYWAAMEDETTGDLKVLSKGRGILRLMSTNLRRVKREQGDGNEMAERVWIDTLKAVEDAGVDVWAAQDTGVEDGGSPGQAALWSAGKLQQKVSSGWGGIKMGWTHQQGHKVGKGLRRGGTFIAVKEGWRAEMHKVRTDRRGWGRYVIRELNIGEEWCINGSHCGITVPANRIRQEGAWGRSMGLADPTDAKLEEEAGEAQGGWHIGQARQGSAGSPGATGYIGGWREGRSCKPSEPGSVRPGI